VTDTETRTPILVVDDHPLNLKLTRLLLSNEGYDVQVAANAEHALEVLQAFKPKLILMDLQLPGMDGFELTKQLKADSATRDVIIVALTAYAMKGDEQRARSSGCDGYIAKPIETRHFASQVAEYLKRS
jgi:CheY-like chemotaxis protein